MSSARLLLKACRSCGAINRSCIGPMPHILPMPRRQGTFTRPARRRCYCYGHMILYRHMPTAKCHLLMPIVAAPSACPVAVSARTIDHALHSSTALVVFSLPPFPPAARARFTP
jgi:hypothetical protein